MPTASWKRFIKGVLLKETHKSLFARRTKHSVRGSNRNNRRNQMKLQTCVAVTALSLLVASSAYSQVVRGVMTVTGAEMH